MMAGPVCAQVLFIQQNGESTRCGGIRPGPGNTEGLARGDLASRDRLFEIMPEARNHVLKRG